MKKFIAILALAMALCLVCGAAFATIDYAKPKLFQRGNTWYVRFNESPASTVDADGNPAYAETDEYILVLDDYKFDTKLKDLAVADEGKTFVVLKKATCTEDAVLALRPTNTTAKYRTKNNNLIAAAPAVFEAAKSSDNGGDHVLFGLPKDAVDESKLQKIDMAELKKANTTVYNAYKATGHTWTYETVPATCTEAGTMTEVCSVCKAKGEVITSDASGHKNTLTEAQIKKLVSGEEKQVTDADGHEYTTTKASTCVAKGTYTGYCYVCGSKKAVFDMAKNPNGHEYGDPQTEIPATCTKPGQDFMMCTLCFKASLTVETPKLGHDWDVDVTKAATCKAKGEAKKATCSVCGEKVTAKSSAFEYRATITPDEKTQIEAEFAKLGITADGDKLILKEDPDNHNKNWNKLDVFAAETDRTATDVKGNKVIAVPAKCTTDGLDVYVCPDCGKVANKVTLPKLGHKWVTIWQYQDPKTGNYIGTAAPTCALKPDGKPVDQWKVEYCENWFVGEYKEGCELEDPNTNLRPKNIAAAPATEKKVTKLTEAPAHDWGAWTMQYAPTATTPGYWVRACKVCGFGEDYIGNTAPSNGDDPTKPTKSGLQLEEDGTVQLYVDGKPSDASGVYAYNGGRFAVVNGKVDTSINGAVVTSATECLFFANGQVQESYTGLAEYNGEWFVVKAGKVDTGMNGLFAHDGGTFVVAAGRVVKELNGLWLAPDGEWYLISNGQVYWADAEVEYDGATFTVKGGKVVA